jgi:O-antigen/teichoic acid export membrane protein
MGLARKSVGTFISKIAIFALRFPISILVARFLGPEGKGLVYLLTTSAVVCATLASLGLGPAAIYFIGKDRKCLPSMLGNLLVVTAVMSVTISVAGLMFLHYGRPDLYLQLPGWMWSIVALMVPLHLMRGLLMQVLSGILRIKEINLLEVATIGSHLFLIVLLVAFLKGGIGGAIVATLLSESVAALGFLIMVFHYGGRPTEPNLLLFKASVRFGMKSHLANVMKLLNFRLDAFLVAILASSGVHATGVYSLATSLAELLVFIPRSIRLSLFPMVAARSTTEANRLTAASCRHALLLTLVGALGLGLIGVCLIPSIYGSAFVGAIIPLLILLPGLVMQSQVPILYSYLDGRGRPEVTIISALAALIVTVILDFALIPQYGIKGAAIASSCAYTVEFVVTGVFFIHFSQLGWKESFVPQSSDLHCYQEFFARSYKIVVRPTL